MKNPRFKSLGIVVAGLAVAVLLTGCGKLGAGSSDPTPSPSSTASADAATVTPIDLTSDDAINALCGDDANVTYEHIKSAVDADSDSDERKSLSNWGVADTKDDAKLDEIVADLKTRAETACTDVTAGDKVGVEDHTGGTKVVPVVGASGDPIVIDTTSNPATPPLMPALLDGTLRFTAQTLSWAGIVERVGAQQWYKDGVNSFAAQTGFTWDDVLKFASVNKVVDGKVQGVNALAIQIYNQPNLTDGQARDQVRQYITPDIEKIIGTTVDQLPIQRINNGFSNTVNAGTAAFPKMTEVFDTEQMVRVSLMPIVFNEKGEATGLDGSRGAGIFIDCGNLHWVPKAMWKCTDSSCTKPTPPPAPTPVCAWNPNLPPDSPDCLQPKDWSLSPQEPGWVPLGPGELTDGHQSQDQQDSGDTRGNAVDDQVPSGTGSGDTTPDTKPSDQGGPVAPGATPGGDNQSGGGVDEGNTNQNDGGTNGDTCVPDPIAGITC
jgi:hypothetical protein